ncbi:hypothetical protein B0H14DRAFT_3435270 [Mycena olivaceomarginata]|nr:hypothetical protein B0H14DRAFT_3435270 [Mycena olivaceomarginata]
MFASPASSSSSSSSSGSSRSRPVHTASLVDPATHAPALLQLLDIKILDGHNTSWIASRKRPDHALNRAHPSLPRRSVLPSPSSYRAKFAAFAHTVLSRAEVTPPTLLVALVYIARARPHISIALEQWALERVFLGALILASKYTNDSSLKNVHWALCTGVFGKRDIGRIEREFLEVLDWELGVREGDLVVHHEGLEASRRGKVVSAECRPTPTPPAYLTPPPPYIHHQGRRPSVPELEPSSPQSSLASMSPRTPYSHLDIDVDVPAPSAHSYAVSKPLQTQSHGQGNKFHDLLRSFPLPRHSHAASYAILVDL